MSFNQSTRSIPTLIRTEDEPEHMRRRDARTESPYHPARASVEILAQKAQVMKEWRQGFEDYDREVSDNGEADIEIEDQEMEPEPERS